MAALGVLVAERNSLRVLTAFGLASDPSMRSAIESALADGSLPEQNAGRLLQFDAARGGKGQTRAVGLVVCDDTLILVLVRENAHALALFDFIGVVPFACATLELFLSNPHLAITVADDEGRLRYLSAVHEQFFGLRRGEGLGKRAEAVIPNSRLGAVARTGKPEIGLLTFKPGVTRVVNRIPVTENDRIVGAIGQVMFKGPESLSRMNRRLEKLRDQVAHYKKELDQLRVGSGGGTLIGVSASMQRLRREIETVARLDVPVLILGESGTGKELVAQALHEMGERAAGAAMVSLNLAALPASLIESELFGYAPGSYTGARREGQPGKLEQAEGGTLFLDEVADVPMEMQIKLLRVLEDHQVERLGSRTSRRVDFRVVSATNRDLGALIEEGRFRLDLYYRISGVVLHVPALHERLEDIPLLLTHFVQRFCSRNDRSIPGVDVDVASYLAAQPWPGNVRQLRHRIEEALVFCDGRRLKVEDFSRGERRSGPTRASAASVPAGRQPASADASRDTLPLKETERQSVLDAIARCNGNKKEAAQSLGISRSYLYKILARPGAADRTA